MTETTKKFEFTGDTQIKIVSMLLNEEENIKENLEIIKAEYFNNPALKEMVTLLVEFYQKYGRGPTRNEFLEELNSFLDEQKKKQKIIPYEEYLNVAVEVLEISSKGNFDYIKDKLVDFSRLQAMKQALLESFEKLKKADYEGILYSIQKAFGAGARKISLKEICLNEVEPENVNWLWQDRIPEGKLTLIVGDPGVGKSFLTAFLSKHVTTGEGWPDCPHGSVRKGSVILLNAEDGLRDTIVPRLEAAGADRSKITYIKVAVENGEERLFKLDRDISKLEESVKAKKDVKLVIVDPLSAYLGRTDSHKDSDIRGVLAPLARMAEENNTAVVAVMHLNKSTVLQAIYRVSGSIAFVGVARVIWYVAEDKEDEGRRLFSVLKNNLSPKPKCDLGLGFQIKDKIIWEEVPMRKTVDEILCDQEKAGQKGARDKAMEFLKDVLKDGAVLQPEIKALAQDESFSWGTVRHAKNKMGIEAYKAKGERGQWYWQIPEKDKEKDEEGEKKAQETIEKYKENESKQPVKEKNISDIVRKVREAEGGK